jgi:hypothetical protein
MFPIFLLWHLCYGCAAVKCEQRGVPRGMLPHGEGPQSGAGAAHRRRISGCCAAAARRTDVGVGAQPTTRLEVRGPVYLEAAAMGGPPPLLRHA